MCSFLLLLSALQALRFSAGVPVTDFTPIFNDALRESILQLNRNTVSDHLLAATRSELLYITPTGPNEMEVDLRFSARETLCPKAGGFDTENCELNTDPLAKMAICRSSVSYSFGAVVDVYLQCKDSRDRMLYSSSESNSYESSEEISYLRRRPQFQNEYYSSVDWNSQNAKPFGQSQGNGPATRRPQALGNNLSQGLPSMKKPRRKPSRESLAE
ncbi:secreted phosphoprotein 24-like [Carcharodon carcharias]|uniref:secreted phosphoprotein 24-like n=1 Tax=Carcharodon carcharias TaxID=13397 RepID=UPI001B7F2A3B|nr:secreted phosphoprotein 24-like [Carcharodon carcharias]